MGRGGRAFSSGGGLSMHASVQPQLYSHSEEYQTESSRGSDLSDIMEEDEEELYSEMQLEEGRRRSINSHNTLKVRQDSPAHAPPPGDDWANQQPPCTPAQ